MDLENRLNSFLFLRVHQVLLKFDITHFLCYGSLWGQIRHQKLLPWHSKGEFCILNHELTKQDEAVFISYFLKSNMKIRYVMSDGFYRVENKFNDNREHSKEPFVDLFVFDHDKTVSWITFYSLPCVFFGWIIYFKIF